MAIPENYIDKITKDGQSRMISPAADMVRVNSEEYEGDNLGDVLDEIADAVSDAASSADLSGLFADAAYNSTTKEINFLDKNNTVVATIDAKPFVRDGMVSSVSLSNGVLTITFNTDAGKEPIEISLGDLFNADNYYTKTDADGKFVVQVNGKGLSSNDYTNADKAAVATIADKADKTTVPAAYQPRLIAGTGISISGDTISLSQAAQTSLGKADTAVQGISVNGTPQQKDQNGNVNIQSVDGVTPHIGANGNWFIGTTDTDVKARGVDGINVSDPADIEVVHNLDDEKSENFDPTSQVAVMGSDMGKVLKVAISTLIDSMGEYCFPMGRPTLSFEGPKADIIHTFNNSHVALSNTAQRVDIGASFETTLGTDDNLYVIDDDSVVVKMGGTTLQGAYSAATGKVTIAEVTDVIEITANAITYVGYGEQNSPLVLMLDGKNQGSTASQWENLANANKPLVLSGGYTKGTDHVEFDGTDGFGLIDGYNEALPFESTSVESVLSFDSLPNVVEKAMLVMANCKNQSITLQFTSSGNVMGATQAEGATAPIAAMGMLANAFAANEKVRVVEYGNDFMLNNTAVDKSGTDKFIIVPNNTSAYSQGYGDLCVSGYYTRAGAYMYPFDGKIFAIRIYSKKLSVDELTQNWKVDKKRFNIS